MKVLRVSLLILIVFSLMTGICYGQTAEDYYDQGIVYLSKGMYDEAVAEFKKAIEINPSYATARNNLAVAYYCKEEFILAIEHCDKAIELGYRVHPKFLKELEPYRKK